MTNVSEWNVSAGLNNASPPDGWPEGMQRSAVNDTAREMMAALARWYSDVSGSLVTGGGTLNYSLNTNSDYAALTDLPMLLVRCNATNTGAVTLDIDALGAVNLTKASGVALSAGDFVVNRLYAIIYNPDASRLEIINVVPSDLVFLPAGTTQGFIQAAAPTGWTKSVNALYSDKALRLTTGTPGSGGSTAFSSVMTTQHITKSVIDNFTLGTFSVTGFTPVTGNINTLQQGGGGSFTTLTNVVAGSASVTVTSGGSGNGLDFNIAYVDMIVAVKD